MAVNWRDIQERAIPFIHSYRDAKDEDRDAKPFWKDLMALYGVEARSIGAFEERVKVYGRPGIGKIDYFAPRKFLVEAKSLGKDLDDAYEQALEYFDSLPSEIRPRYIVVSDFARIRIHDLEKEQSDRVTEFTLADLPSRVHDLAFFTDEEVQTYKPEEHIDVRAVRVIGRLHKALKESNYPPEHLPRLLTRLVFCFFADDIGIFEKNLIRRYLESNTKPDGSDIGDKISKIFDVLNTSDGTAGSRNERQTGMDDTLKALPWVNGGMYAEPIKVIFGTRDVRDMILECIKFDWSHVSPAIFGSMFQSVMNEKERHDLGAHYTSETNIKKVINALFLEELQYELDVAATNKAKLEALWQKIANITLLDPACGCGNFLVISYREMRTIENEIIRRLHGKADKRALAHAEAGHHRLDLGGIDLSTISKLSVESMYGIELDAFPAEIAKLSLWLVDQKMNMDLGRIFGKHLVKLPLTEQPHIVQGNALKTDWESVVPKEKLTFILGNPPFLGSRVMNAEQKEEMHAIFPSVHEVGFLDYVTAWYMKAAQLIQGTDIRCAFVSTNSISQGEQPGILWEALRPLGIYIQFAHRTFKWSNEATGKAAVYCVIVGFGIAKPEKARLYEYEDIRGEANEVLVKEINPYLIPAPSDVLIRNRQKPICAVPDMSFGNMPRDGGMLILDEQERNDLISEEPYAEKFIRQYIGAQEFLHSEKRYCLWLVDARPDELKSMSEVMRRVEAVRAFRSLSVAASTRKMADTPYLFAQRTQPVSDYILVPAHTSENRKYVPMGFLSKDIILTNSSLAVPDATLYHFGVLESEMHMAWMRAVAGRLKSDYRYSKDIVYNNFPWPENPTGVQKKAVEDAARAVLDARAKYLDSTLADLYDPNTMPADLLKAHKELDRAVDACYGKKSFKSEPERLEFLFNRYQELIASQNDKSTGKK